MKGSVYERKFRSYWFRQLLFCAVIAAAVVVAWALGMHSYLSSRISPAASVTVAYVIVLIAVLSKKPWRIFTDRSFTGTVTDVKYRESQTASREDMRISATVPLYTMIIKVDTGKGGQIKKSVESLEPLYQDMWYHAGDRVIYHRGTKFPLIEGGRRFCAYCGDGLRDGGTKCHKCGQENE